MKTFKLSGIDNRIYFQNLNRIPAEEELGNVLKELKAAGCKVSKAKAAGLDDIYSCNLDGMQFKVYYTGEEAFIHAEDVKDIKKIENIFK